MKLLKRENWWIWLLMLLFSNGASTILLGAIFDTYEKDSWYAKWYNWVIGAIFIFPFFIMILVFYIEMTCKTAYKLNIKGSELYLSPYIWFLMIIIPFLGWLIFIIFILYLEIEILIKLYNGDGEKYI